MSACNDAPAGKDINPNANTDNSDLIRIPLTKSASTSVRVTVDIQPGTGSPAQKQAWNRFWQKIIIGVKKETGE